MNWSPARAKSLAALFSTPITIAEYVDKTRIVPATGRAAVVRWVKMGVLFEAGRIPWSPENPGRPAMRYCSDARVAARARLELEVDKLASVGVEGETVRLAADRNPSLQRAASPPLDGKIQGTAAVQGESVMKKPEHDGLGPFGKALEVQQTPISSRIPGDVLGSVVWVHDTLNLAFASAQQLFGEQFTADHVLGIYDRFVARMNVKADE